MNDDLDRPADTAMMRIVHEALRRDLKRARVAIAGPGAFPADAQRTAIAEHLGWMTGFLHRHHESEDEWLYPLVRRRLDRVALHPHPRRRRWHRHQAVLPGPEPAGLGRPGHLGHHPGPP
jgi:Hemerythrin HHE cation binding domain